MLNCAIAEASVRDRKLLVGPSARAEPDVATVGVVCKVLAVSPKLGSAIDRRERWKDAPVLGEWRRSKQSSPQMWLMIILVGQSDDQQCRRVLTDDDVYQ